MFGQLPGLPVWVPLAPGAAGADAAGAGLAALTIATPPTAIMPTERRVVAMTLRAPDMWRLAAGASGGLTITGGVVDSIEVSLPFLNLA